MGDVVNFRKSPRRRADKRRVERDEYVRGQQILANAIFHWKNDGSEDARAGVRFLMHHLATAFRADDAPLQPRPLETSMPKSPASARDEPGEASSARADSRDSDCG